jgi:hypothetical protein
MTVAVTQQPKSGPIPIPSPREAITEALPVIVEASLVLPPVWHELVEVVDRANRPTLTLCVRALPAPDLIHLPSSPAYVRSRPRYSADKHPAWRVVYAVLKWIFGGVLADVIPTRSTGAHVARPRHASSRGAAGGQQAEYGVFDWVSLACAHALTWGLFVLAYAVAVS